MQEYKTIRKGLKALAWAIVSKTSTRINKGNLNGFGIRIQNEIEQRSKKSRLQFSRAWFRLEPMRETLQKPKV